MSREDFDPSPDVPGYVYARMADDIAARVESGELPERSRLPGERDLADDYGVAIGTARRAVRELRDRGLLVTYPGKGTYVVSTPEPD